MDMPSRDRESKGQLLVSRREGATEVDIDLPESSKLKGPFFSPRSNTNRNSSKLMLLALAACCWVAERYAVGEKRRERVMGARTPSFATLSSWARRVVREAMNWEAVDPRGILNLYQVDGTVPEK